MNKKLFEMVYREASGDLEQVTSEKVLSRLLDMGCDVYADGTGPFGESRGAKVTDFGKVKNLRNKLKGIKWLAEEEGYDDVEEWFAANGEATAIVLDQLIGQEPCNFYTLDAHNIEDLDLWASTSKIALFALGKDMSGKIEKTCPNCGNEVLHYIKLPKQVMGREEFDACTECGTMIPHNS